MVRHTGTRYWPIIAYCPKYRIKGTALHDTNRGNQEWWKHDIRTVNKPLIDLGPQNLKQCPRYCPLTRAPNQLPNSSRTLGKLLNFPSDKLWFSNIMTTRVWPLRGVLSQTSVTPSHNLLTIMCLTLYLFTETFTLKKNPCIYTLFTR